MAPLPYTNSGAAVAFYVVLAAFGLVELRVRLRSLLNRQGSPSDRGSFALLYISITTAMAAAFVLAASVHGAAIRFARWPFFVAGVVLIAAGIGFRQWAVAVLGRFFTTDVRVHRDQLVVETGPYRWVRHPSYTGLLMTLIGVGLALGNWASLATLGVLPTAGLVVRIRVEERALLDGLGEPYRRYAEGRARLIPGVW